MRISSQSPLTAIPRSLSSSDPPLPPETALDAAELEIGDGTAPLSRAAQHDETPSKLVVLSGLREGVERPLVTTLDVGADPACQLVLDDRGVSRVHARFGLRNGKAWVVDLSSRNGTYYQGSRVTEAELPLGAIVQLGETLLGLYPRWHVREVEPSRSNHFGQLFGTSLAMREVFAVLERVAASNASVLIEGESGTGKELAARSIHFDSARAAGPYVVFDCTTVTRELAESELFGHRRGAFSGATADREGAFSAASGGTIFLDEIGELPLDLQPKLLRVLESGEVRRVGETHYRKVDVRVIAATNRNLNAEVRRGRFRSDLLYRLAVVRAQLPALRARPEDIVPIIERLIGDQLQPGTTIGGVNLHRLMAYSWPGNVRELRNVLLRALALAPRPKPGEDPRPTFDQLAINLAADGHAPTTVGYSFPGVDSPVPYKDAKLLLLSQFDDEYVQALMRRHSGNVTLAAKAAGLSRKHVYALLRRVDGSREGEE